MEKIYAPWRSAYIKGNTYRCCDAKKTACVFCDQLAKNKDEKFFILKRFKHCFIMLNLYPYNSGHLMVLPAEHKGTLEALTPEERADIMEATNICVNVLTKELKPEGFNIGINLGKAGGGGIPSHLHVHVLPRWEGDTNYLPLLANTKQISVDLVGIYKKLKKRFDTIK